MRLSKMPWLGVLRSKTANDLRRILSEVGSQASTQTSHAPLMARILREATKEGRDGTSLRRSDAPDTGTLQRLLEQELSDYPHRTPASRAVGYIDECPWVVRGELRQAASSGRA